MLRISARGLLICAVVATLVMFALAPEANANKAPIYIGVAAPLTGTTAAYGKQASDAARIAVKEINAAGGIDGRTIELIFMDDRSDPKEAALVAQRLCDDSRIVAVVGHMASSTTLAAMPIYNKARMPVITPTASNHKVTEMGWDNVIRIVLRDVVQSPQAAALLTNNLKCRRIAILFANNDLGRGTLQTAKPIITKTGARIVAEETWTPGLDKDFSVQLAKVQRAGADGVLLATDYNEGAMILSQAHRMGGFDNVKFVSDAAMLYDRLLEHLNTESEKMIHLACAYNPFANRPVQTKFIQEFARVNDSLPAETAVYTYDAVHIIADALRKGSVKDTLIQDIKQMVFDNLICGETVSFDENGDRRDISMSVVVVRNGHFVGTDIRIDMTGVF